MRNAIVVILTLSLMALVGCGKQKKPTLDVDLHTAALKGNVEAIQARIDAGADLNKRDQYGSTPLIVATTFGQTEAAIALIDAGADLQVTSSDGATPLHVAAFLCREDIVAALLEAGADKAAVNNYGSTPLQSVQGPFEQVKPFYDQLRGALAPFGLELDYERIEAARPRVAAMLE
ncbi:ankyrin repeat domain-containing protein [candidate division GN15 bacterium]|nr:ankyrin repeat domain-containing protein [candidate division GN15 bacterium]